MDKVLGSPVGSVGLPIAAGLASSLGPRTAQGVGVGMGALGMTAQASRRRRLRELFEDPEPPPSADATAAMRNDQTREPGQEHADFIKRVGQADPDEGIRLAAWMNRDRMMQGRPVEVRSGNTLVDPSSGEPLYTAPTSPKPPRWDVKGGTLFNQTAAEPEYTMLPETPAQGKERLGDWYQWAREQGTGDEAASRYAGTGRLEEPLPRVEAQLDESRALAERRRASAAQSDAAAEAHQALAAARRATEAHQAGRPLNANELSLTLQRLLDAKEKVGNEPDEAERVRYLSAIEAAIEAVLPALRSLQEASGADGGGGSAEAEAARFLATLGH